MAVRRDQQQFTQLGMFLDQLKFHPKFAHVPSKLNGATVASMQEAGLPSNASANSPMCVSG